MSAYTPAPHESRARFIAGSVDLIQRRDGCTLAEAEETAIGEWERWMEWHNVRVRRGVVAEEPEWEYAVAREEWPSTPVYRRRDLEAAEAFLLNPPLGEKRHGWLIIKQRKTGPWVPVKQKGHKGHRIVEQPTATSTRVPRWCTTCEVQLEPREQAPDA